MDENNIATTTDKNPNTVEPTVTVAQPEQKKDVKPDSTEVEKLKAALSKANGEAAEWKRKLREKQTEAERAEAERLEAEQAMKDELATLRKEKAVSEYKNKALALNFDADNAEKLANALADGDTDAMFDALKAFVEATVTKANNDALNRQPSLSAGTPPTTNTANASTALDEENKLRRWAGLPPKN